MPDAPSPCPSWPLRLTLRDGRQVTVRPIRGEDSSAVVEAFKGLSADSRYRRFMAPLHDLSAQTVQATTHPDPARELVLVAVAGTSTAGPLVGGVRYVAADRDRCEFAVTIIDAWQGVGLARQLMEQLIAIAGARGFHTMHGYVLASNHPMLALARRLGFDDQPCPEEHGVRLITRPLPSAHPT